MKSGDEKAKPKTADDWKMACLLMICLNLRSSFNLRAFGHTQFHRDLFAETDADHWFTLNLIWFDAGRWVIDDENCWAITVGVLLR